MQKNIELMSANNIRSWLQRLFVGRPQGQGTSITAAVARLAAVGSTVAFNGSGSFSNGSALMHNSTTDVKRSISAANSGGEFGTELDRSNSSTSSLTLENSLFGDNRVDFETAVHANCTSVLVGDSNILAFSDGTLPTLVRRTLKPLADNDCTEDHLAGYPATTRCSKTHALSEGSSALDSVVVFSRIFDQRGFPSISTIDMGSHEGFIADPACFVVPTKNEKVFSFCL